MPEGLSLGRIQAGFAQASQELTVAAANLNFDFTLVKVEAPPEYRPVGNALSTSRIQNAETGPLHVTARRLGALFDGVCPPTPQLIKAYGTRASEIASEVTNTNKHHRQNWIQTEYGGVDATSIWAAATSSKATIPVHLLACIIARMCKPTEATSLWVELVTERKREILTSFENGEPTTFNLATAVQQEITREHLAGWDASARAWLQTADTARQIQYKQFLLIIQNVSYAVHEGKDTLYADAIRIWTSALSAMEHLVLGIASVVEGSPVLLGLSAWHIFPDMIVFSSSSTKGSTTIAMNDPLVKAGGILSLGISDSNPKESRGVYWSLSLAHHRFYGEPVKQTRRLDVDGRRLSFDELILVCLGSLLRCWGLSKEATHNSFKILRAVARITSTQHGFKDDDSWNRTICDPTSRYLQGEKQAILAVSLGRRRPNFLPIANALDRKPLFKLLRLPTLLYVLKDIDHMIELLRRLSSRVEGLNNGNSIILCTPKAKRCSLGRRSFASTFEGEDTEPSSQPPKKRRQYSRWIGILDTEIKEYLGITHYIFNCSNDSEDSNSQDGITNAYKANITCNTGNIYDKMCADYRDAIQRKHPNELVKENNIWLHNSEKEEAMHAEHLNDPYSLMFGLTKNYDDANHVSYNHKIYEHAAVYTKNDGKYFDVDGLNGSLVTLEDILWCFESGFIDLRRLMVILEQDPAFDLLLVLRAIYTLYQEPAAGGATISGAIIENEFQPPVFSKNRIEPDDWLGAGAHAYLSINQRAAICLIGYFETGQNVGEGMNENYNIIGLSGGDSIYILTALLSDPLLAIPTYKFSRVLGNTGRAGFSLLSCPSDLRVRQLDQSAWRVEQMEFDEMPHDYFQNTSLHLSFTDWRVPIVSYQSVGHRDADVHIVEAVVSVRDAGKWVADVDIHQALADQRLILLYHETCSHDNPVRQTTSHSSILSVETWDQVLDCAEEAVVVRCFDNWVARLAVVSVLHRHGMDKETPIVVCPRDVCWECVYSQPMIRSIFVS